MNSGRRFFLSGVAATLAGIRATLAGAQAQRHDSHSPIPQIPDVANPNGTDDTLQPPRSDPRVQLREDQKVLRCDVDHLLQLAKELKEESDKTPDTDVLSLSLVKKAEDIEKLAHQIKDRIRES